MPGLTPARPNEKPGRLGAITPDRDCEQRLRGISRPSDSSVQGRAALSEADEKSFKRPGSFSRYGLKNLKTSWPETQTGLSYWRADDGNFRLDLAPCIGVART